MSLTDKLDVSSLDQGLLVLYDKLAFRCVNAERTSIKSWYEKKFFENINQLEGQNAYKRQSYTRYFYQRQNHYLQEKEQEAQDINKNYWGV